MTVVDTHPRLCNKTRMTTAQPAYEAPQLTIHGSVQELTAGSILGIPADHIGIILDIFTTS
jgi:hypothetical protein